MADEKQTPTKTTTMEGPAAMRSAPKDTAPPAGSPRYVATELTNEGYVGSRVRRLERYQAFALKVALNKLGITSNDELVAKISDPAVTDLAARFLCGCLVHPEQAPDPFSESNRSTVKSGIARLLRKSDAGRRRILDELSPSEIAGVLVKAIDQAEVWNSKRT